MASLARLLMPRDEAERLLGERIQAGESLLVRARMSAGGADTATAYGLLTGWDRYNDELLQRMFIGGQILDDYRNIERALGTGGIAMGGVPSVTRLEVIFHQALGHIMSVRERLALIETAPDGAADDSPSEDEEAGLRVFVVHGHHGELKQSVARLVERLDLDAVILDEQPNEGLTMIEKFEKNARAWYAVVLMTADDVGAPKTAASDLRPRARQNVVFELGYFVARLGRGRVAALHQKDVEIPSDYSGVAYIDADRADWRFLLAKDLKAAGLPVDLNKIP